MGKWIGIALVVLVGGVVAVFAMQKKQAPEFTLSDTYGNSVSLSDYEGYPVVLDFWASWCPPCRAAMPAIDRIHADYNGRAYVFGINVRDNQDPGEFMSSMGVTYPTLVNGDAVAQDYNVKGIPTLVVIDRDGAIVYQDAGWGPGIERNIRDALDKALQ